MSSTAESTETLLNQIEVLKKEKQAYEYNEKMFQALVETAVGDIGQDFFENIVKKLSEWLNAECVLIGKLVDNNKVESCPMYLDGNITNGYSYYLEKTPCDLTSKKGYCVIEDNLADIFPESRDAKELKIKGYLGIALYNKDGEANGILCAMSRSKLNLPPQAESIMKIVGQRITSEMERIKTQNQLEHSEKELRISNASKDLFFSIIAHELKGPFNSLSGLSEILSEEVDFNNHERIRRISRMIHEVSHDSYSLLNNLLDWSMASTNGMIFTPVKINLLEFTNEIINSKTIAINKDIHLVVKINEDIVLYGDKNMLNTVFRNLISNAVKYTPEGGTISIEASSENQLIVISIKDTGIGMDVTALNKLFKIEEAFSTRGLKDEKGTGLGLVLCKTFIEKHNGEITANSESGKGSSFKIKIPNNLQSW